MKKLLTAAMAVLTAAVMAGCGSTAGEQLVEDISGDTFTATEAEAPEIEETSEAAKTSGTEAGETTAETESVSEQETTVETNIPETETTTEETEASPEEKDGMRIAEFTDMEGKVWVLEEEDSYYIFGREQTIAAEHGYVYVLESAFENGRYSEPNKGYDDDEGYIMMYIKDDILYGCYNDDPDEYIVFSPYYHPDFSLSDFDGEWLLTDSFSLAVFLNIKDGKGTYQGIDDYNAELILDNDKITLILGENKWEYTTYVISDLDTDSAKLYLINTEYPVALGRY